MRILLTGAGGFVGRHLIKELVTNDHKVLAFDKYFASIPEGVEPIIGDLTVKEEIDQVISTLAPDACIHLAAIAFVPSGHSDPSKMLSVNIAGTVNLLESLRKYSAASRLLFVSSAHVYGHVNPGDNVNEDHPLAPLSVYAISKAAAELATLAYAKQHSLNALTCRPANHTGPGQSTDYVVASFAKQIKEIQRGEMPPLMSVGNLQSVRDFSDVRDIVRAYRFLIEKGEVGTSYNISAGNRVTIGELLDQLCDLAGIKPEFRNDPDKYRPTDSSPLLDISRLENDTGWAPEYELCDTLRDILEEF